MQVKWYATILRQDLFAAEVSKIAPISLHYGATQYRVHVDTDDGYKINQLTWVPTKAQWYEYWEGPEMIEFRARWMGKYQIPITYSWADEIATGEKGVGIQTSHGETNPNPDDTPAMSSTDAF